MRQVMKWLIAWILAFGMGWTQASLAQDLGGQESNAIHNVVQSQLEAFAADDAETAFDLTSDETQALLGSPQALLGIVREWYAPLYRPQKAIFSPAEVAGEHAIQEVVITDSNNVIWVAIFLMQLDQESQWKIDSYHLVGTASVEV